MKFLNNIAMPLLLPLSTVICLFCSLLVVPEGYADRITLKDGTNIVSEKVWQTEDHVHFILIGTRDVEIRYAKEIVEKIEQQGITVKPGVVRKPLKTPATRKIITAKPTQPTPGPGKSAEAVAKLPERQRRVFVLKEIEGFKYKEISEIFDMPVGTVKSIGHRAVRRLRQELSVYNPKKERWPCDAKTLSV